MSTKSIFMSIKEINETEKQKENLCESSELIMCQCDVNDGIFIRYKEGYYRKYFYKDILWIEASGSYCYIHLRNNRKEVLVQQLSAIENVLPVDLFKRIHRSYIVNMFAVEGFIGNQLYVGDNCLSVSEPYRRIVLRCFRILDAEKVHLKHKRKKIE